MIVNFPEMIVYTQSRSYTLARSDLTLPFNRMMFVTGTNWEHCKQFLTISCKAAGESGDGEIDI